MGQRKHYDDVFFSTAAQYPTTVSNYEMIIYILIKIYFLL